MGDGVRRNVGTEVAGEGDRMGVTPILDITTYYIYNCPGCT